MALPAGNIIVPLFGTEPEQAVASTGRNSGPVWGEGGGVGGCASLPPASLRLRYAMTSPGAGARRVTCATGRGRAAAVPLAGLTTWSRGQAHPTALGLRRASSRPGLVCRGAAVAFFRCRRTRPAAQTARTAASPAARGGWAGVTGRRPSQARARCATQGRCAKLPRARARIVANSCRERRRFVTPLGQAQPSLPCDCTALPVLLLLLRRLPNRLDRRAPGVR